MLPKQQIMAHIATYQDPSASAEAKAEALDALTRAHMRYVFAVARKYLVPGINIEDLTNEGWIGLVRAIEKFDINSGHHFLTYADSWIRHKMQRFVENDRLIALPAHVHETMRRAKRRSGGPVDPEGQFKNKNVGRAVRMHERAILSMDAPARPEDTRTLGEFIAGPASVEEEAVEHMQSLDIHHVISCLDERSQRVICMRFGIGTEGPHTLNQIGQELNLTRQRVRQIEQLAFVRIRELLAVRGYTCDSL
jgi:RNA polymerase primary sigma factor